ncbi:MAG: acyltransferase family protein, partial [Lachnospiraceae bacterium]|nr:acyltransferase family protein [Lachnospiraceae bacterium]
MSSKRDSYMDFLKGLAIVAVIVGHSLNNIIPQGIILFNLVYSFHMPLLMFVSAYIEEQNREKYTMKECRMLVKRVCGLLIPYVSWNILYVVISGQILEVNIKDFGLMLLGYKQSGLWFFPVLFGLKILHFLYWMIKKKWGYRSNFIEDIFVCLLLEVITVLFSLLTKNQYIINMLSYAIPYFLAVIIVDNEALQKVINSEWIISFAFLIYFLLFKKFSFYNTHWT